MFLFLENTFPVSSLASPSHGHCAERILRTRPPPYFLLILPLGKFFRLVHFRFHGIYQRGTDTERAGRQFFSFPGWVRTSYIIFFFFLFLAS